MSSIGSTAFQSKWRLFLDITPTLAWALLTAFPVRSLRAVQDEAHNGEHPLFSGVLGYTMHQSGRQRRRTSREAPSYSGNG
ncbi:uncharacterized protein BCR38DRAFT_442155 [Pseudomassariella vexata]|uniref:Uncharacterized protein n=1 Tax=Pseudomassariella vexata TaxID=1141098 RepID=A0A1Y2DN16_9PEZI|nr:uncharacterized protein BCR38DRAFT_442155 [Pseudomassariella vexata]ORY60688.1 hypothetical protein BCR38DRAFT_442155 [Pseudomassariella vexata]